MDFFEHQDAARRKTSLLVFYFLLAVTLIIVSIYAVFWAVFVWSASQQDGARHRPAPSLWNPTLFAWVAGGTVLIVTTGTLTKIAALSSGGESVARMLGARPLEHGTTDPDEKRLLNVVEEIALASGTSVPRVFLTEDASINAFAAGFSTRDAVIGVTRGCMNQLSRDELQGVIAHEFSHILNGDMRLNIRLIGTLHGILALGIIGYWIFRTALHSPSSRASERKKSGNPLLLIILGLSVMAIGYIGIFFGRLIKSAVSRQREFLADASSVQFTRNPDGIAGALKKIGASSSRISSSNAEQASHLFFANGLAQSIFGLLATHPPLVERIRRIDPSFDGDFAKVEKKNPAWMDRHSEAQAGGTSAPVASFAAQARSGDIPVKPENILQSVGNPQQAHITYISSLLASIPETIKRSAREPDGSQALLYAMLLNSRRPSFERQIQYLRANAEAVIYEKTLEISEAAERLPPETRLPLADMALAALSLLTRDQFEALKRNLQYLASADHEISLFEYVLLRTVIRHLNAAFGTRTRQPMKYHDIQPLMRHAACVLSLLAYYGAANDEEADMMFRRGMSKLANRSIPILPREQCELRKADRSLDVLAESSPRIKKRLLDAAVECILANGQTTIREIEMLRAIADSLDCPMPPFLPDTAAA